jgi:hypothetical protein
VFDFGANSCRTTTPVVQIPMKWQEYLSGQNPSDPFRGRPIVPQTQFDAGGWDSLEPMFSWTMRQSGVQNYVSYNKDAKTTTEMVVSAIPGLNRTLKTSDYGYREQQREGEDAERQARAKHRLEMPTNVQSLAAEYAHLSQIHEQRRTPEQMMRFEELTAWHGTIFKPMDEGVTAAEQGGDKKTAQTLRDTLGTLSKSFEKVR